MRVDGNQRTLDFRHLPRRPIVAENLDQDDIAGFRAGLIIAWPTDPTHLLGGNAPSLTVDEADPPVALSRLQEHG